MAIFDSAHSNSDQQERRASDVLPQSASYPLLIESRGLIGESRALRAEGQSNVARLRKAVEESRAIRGHTWALRAQTVELKFLAGRLAECSRCLFLPRR